MTSWSSKMIEGMMSGTLEMQFEDATTPPHRNRVPVPVQRCIALSFGSPGILNSCSRYFRHKHFYFTSPCTTVLHDILLLDHSYHFRPSFRFHTLWLSHTYRRLSGLPIIRPHVEPLAPTKASKRQGQRHDPFTRILTSCIRHLP